MKNDSITSTNAKPIDVSTLDALTGGAFTAPTSGERTARIKEWLVGNPSPEQLADVFKELSHRDKGAAKPVKEKLDEAKRIRNQDLLATEWAAKAQALLSQARLNVADAMAWQRDAAKAGAPLSREPLGGLKAALADRVKAIEDLHHRIQVEREAAVLLAQRIEVMSTKPMQESLHVRSMLETDVREWGELATALASDAQWDSIDPRFAPMLDVSRAQLMLVWQAFDGALTQAGAALADPAAPLPAVPVWADEIRTIRGDAIPDLVTASMTDAELGAMRAKATEVVNSLLTRLAADLEQGHVKTLPRLAMELRQTLKEHGRWLSADAEGKAQALLAQAGDLEGWQRWRADQLRQELVAKAEQLLQAPEGQRVGGRKMQDALRALREQWKQTDQGGKPNHALWKRFDEACTQAHKVVEQWLDKMKAESAEHRAQRLSLIKELEEWTVQHHGLTDWKVQARDLHRMADNWRNSGHLSEKQFAELQPLWKQAMAVAKAPLEAAQTLNLERRQQLIQQAVVLGAADVLRMDAVRALQHEWQHEAQGVPLDRRQEQKLWDAFRKPIDDAFARKSADREKQAANLTVHDQRVLAASKSLSEANASQDVQRIQAAMSALAQAMQGRDVPLASPAQTPPAAVSEISDEKAAQALTEEQKIAIDSDASELVVDDATSGVGSVADTNPTAVAAPVEPVKPARKVVAVRGDDRPGMKRTEPVVASRGAPRPGERRDGPGMGRRDAPQGGRRDGGRDFESRTQADRGPRLGDAAFRAQRDAIEQAQFALKKLASQAHGHALTQLMDAWRDRRVEALPSVAELGGRVNASTRAAWVQALSAPAAADVAAQLLRVEMAAEVPTPAAHLDARRALQLQMLTRRNDPAPAQTWGQDVAQVLAGHWDEEHARRLQAALKPLLRRV